MRINLKVPFTQKDEAKGLGSRWDSTTKTWYVQNIDDLTAFKKWMSDDVQAFDEGKVSPVKVPAKKSTSSKQSAGILDIGSKEVEVTRVCECLPWDVCDKCRPTSLAV